MAYTLKQVTIRTNNTEAGMKKIGEIWQDITSGKLPVLFDSEHVFQKGVSTISRYSSYECDENGDYDLSIIVVASDFFQTKETEVSKGLYKKYDVADENGDISICAKKAWEKVWNDRKSGTITRAFTEDYECAVPAEHSKDGIAHCYLYIAVKQAVALE